MSGDSNFGLELVVKSHESQLGSPNDVLTCVVHWILLKRANLRNVGTGAHFSLDSDTPHSEILPDKTLSKADDEDVQLKYRGVGDKKTEKFLFQSSSLAPNSTLIQIHRVSDEKNSSVTLDPTKVVKDVTATNFRGFITY